ncbi:thioredoxin fold domain-containing protein [Butyricimonas sp. Marseille-P3923]|uniref:thioredoxin fold domain-containing protein n=1 Tax=Butyricimonas sp. Marseille-P3923 TaxID=1987504 RepID=UPI000C07E033|nr:thioredoxin fold domain-containing protein [Butyricimonas sp. Marseille-P3923]
MKKILILLVVVFAMGKIYAQTGIRFAPSRVWNRIVSQALAEKKLIFVVCAAEESRACKTLEAEVFTEGKVGEFFNAHFVNVIFDMQKDADGVSHANEWDVKSVPTLLFIDPENEYPICKIVTALNASQLLKAGEMAVDTNKRMDILMKRFRGGERTEALVANLIPQLLMAGMETEVKQIVSDYMNGLNVKEMISPFNWALIMQFENNPLSKTLLAVRDNKEVFYEMEKVSNARQVVNAKLADAMVSMAMEFAMNPNLAIYDADCYNAFIEYLNTADGIGKDISAVWLNTSMLSRQKDWKQMLETMKVIKENGLMPDQIYRQYFSFFIRSLAAMEDNKAVIAGVKWLDDIITTTPGTDKQACAVKGEMYMLKSLLLRAVRKHGGAKKALKESQKYLELFH